MTWRFDAEPRHRDQIVTSRFLRRSVFGGVCRKSPYCRAGRRSRQPPVQARAGAHGAGCRRAARRSRSSAEPGRPSARSWCPAAWKTASNEAVKFDPRSRIKDLMSSNRSPRARLRVCCTVQSPVGCAGPAPPRGHDGSGCHRRGDLVVGQRAVAPAVRRWPGGVGYQARRPSGCGDGGEVGAGNGDGAGVRLLLLYVESHHLVLVHGVPGYHVAARCR